MPDRLIELSKLSPARPGELATVREIAQMLSSFMQRQEVLEEIRTAHIPGASSHEVQEILLVEAERLGFHSEKRGLFSDYAASGIRPDYYLKVGTSGILMEVERGKTLVNNMDLLDLWKCHICQDADYLFLVIPERRPRGSGKWDLVRARVVKRLSTFFAEANYVNVEAVFIMTY